MSIRVGVIGGRGHTGKELLSLLATHPEFTVACASSRSLEGQAVDDYVGQPMDLTFQNLSPDDLPEMDACILALPNDKSEAYVTAIDNHQPDCVVCDLSSDHRFHRDWYYGLPEHNRAYSAGEKRISNPGCYATAMQLAIKPVTHLLQGNTHCFGVSGYSGAGTTPSDKNDTTLLKDNLLPYAPTGHIHEKEGNFPLSNRPRPFNSGISEDSSINLAA
ncbi:MAG: N-acetyl-gamma-glutamyl-phosphate reductase, partial [Pseudomonadota bacterium]